MNTPDAPEIAPAELKAARNFLAEGREADRPSARSKRFDKAGPAPVPLRHGLGRGRVQAARKWAGELTAPRPAGPPGTSSGTHPR